MSLTPLPPEFDLETLSQLPKEELVRFIVQQQRVIEQLTQEVNRLKLSLHSDSQTSSKPPSTDLLKKPEKVKEQSEAKGEAPKRKPGGQPGHPGKTRKGFGRIDRYEILRPQACTVCGHTEFATTPVKVEKQQVAQLVECPIEIVEYQRQSCQCAYCGKFHTVPWLENIVPGQDLGVSLQALLVWLGNYGHLSYEKQQELLQELGVIDIGGGTLQATNTRVYSAIHPKARVQESIQKWLTQAGYQASLLLRALRDKAEQWWYFLDHPEAPPDNNQAERSLGLAVTKRKVSGGSRWMGGFAQTADLLSVIQTCRRQGRSVMEFFRSALMAKSRSGISQPSLLPQPST